jgi:hypothetical protein
MFGSLEGSLLYSMADYRVEFAGLDAMARIASAVAVEKRAAGLNRMQSSHASYANVDRHGANLVHRGCGSRRMVVPVAAGADNGQYLASIRP